MQNVRTRRMQGVGAVLIAGTGYALLRGSMDWRRPCNEWDFIIKLEV